MNASLNRFFSWKRCIALLCADWRLNYKRYLYTFTGALVVMYVILFVSMYNGSEYSDTDYYPVIVIGMLGLLFFIGSSFPAFNRSTGTADYLLLPASTFEKYLTQFIIYVVLGTVCYFLILGIDAHLARWTVLARAAVRSEVVEIAPFRYSLLWDFPQWPFAWLSVLSIGLAMFAIRLFFKNHAFVKSVLVFAGIVGLWLCCMSGYTHLFYPDTDRFIELWTYIVYKDVQNMAIYMYCLCCCICLTALPLAYYKLKEKKL